MNPTDLTQSPLRSTNADSDVSPTLRDFQLPGLTQTKTALQSRQGPLQSLKSAWHDSSTSGEALRKLQVKEANAQVQIGSLAIDIATSDLTKTMVIQSRARNQQQNEKLLAQASVSYVRVQDLAAEGMALHANRYAAQCAAIDQQFQNGVLTQAQWSDKRQRLEALNGMVANAQDNTTFDTLKDTVAGFASALTRLKD